MLHGVYLCKKANVDLIDPAVQAYAEKFSSPEDELLKEINEWTVSHHPEQHMLSGHLQGKVLEAISWMVRPQRILEIGTFTGYSALCLAKGLAPGGQLHTIEIREQDAARARAYFDRSTFAHQIILHTGQALEIIPALNETWDLVFIDADKPAYIDYFEMVMPHVRQNGFILADNIFFHGQVLEDHPTGKSARGIADFNKHISERKDIEKVILTLRDGVYVVRKL
jgi:predicted O-methyltransferase YrrM